MGKDDLKADHAIYDTFTMGSDQRHMASNRSETGMIDYIETEAKPVKSTTSDCGRSPDPTNSSDIWKRIKRARESNPAGANHVPCGNTTSVRATEKAPVTVQPTAPVAERGIDVKVKQAELKEAQKKGEPENCVMVGNLNANYPDAILNLFVEYEFGLLGDVVGCAIFRKVKGKPFAFVQYADVNGAICAICEGDGMDVLDRPVRVQISKYAHFA